ncbi:MAG: hypothetical protein IKE64_00980, partial [Thermoguttaceae bacterium]|nr:hypothetical protein [Thermoguttaceae bacterium]
AMNSGKGSTVKTQMQQLAIALDSYKAKVGEYPPDNFLDTDALERHLKKRWPRARYDNIVAAFLSNVVGIDTTVEDGGVQAAARGSYVSPLIFFLGGPLGPGNKPMGFCLSPTDPFSPDPTAQREDPFFKFPDKAITKMNGIPAFVAQDAPILYFRSEPKTEYFRGDGVVKFWPMDAEIAPEGTTFGIWTEAAAEFGSVTPFVSGFEENVDPTLEPIPIWCDADSFQLIHPGMDKTFAQGLAVNEPRQLGDLTPADEDTITSFSEGLTAGSEK